MSFLAKYLRRRRRRPTRSRRPRRLWWSCLCILRCSVRSVMRLVSIATWTSGEPVSLATVACVVMISVLVALSSGTDLLEGSCELPRLDARGRKDSRRRRGRPQKATSGPPSRRTRRSAGSRSASGRGQCRRRGTADGQLLIAVGIAPVPSLSGGGVAVVVGGGLAGAEGVGE